MRTNLNRNSGRKVRNLRRSGFTFLKNSLLILLAAWAAAFALAPEVFADARPTAAPPSAEGNRFLFIVDTSANMQPHSTEVQQLLVDLFASSANGQIHPGDTLGLWTFNTAVYTGGLPLQTWIPGKEWQVAARMADFLKRSHYGKKSHFDAALADMYEIIKMSDVITVVLISDGEGTMRGTPFDADINAAYKRCFKETKHNHMPVVTVLLAKDGKVTKYSVASLPWPVVFPEVPAAEMPAVVQKSSHNAATSAQPAVQKSAAPPVKMLPPLILQGPSTRPTGQSPLPPAQTPAQPTPPKPAITTTNSAAVAPVPVGNVAPVAAASAARSAHSQATQAISAPDGSHSSGFLAIAGLAIVVCALAFVSVARRPRSSAPGLIVTSVNQPE